LERLPESPMKSMGNRRRHKIESKKIPEEQAKEE
jgi:hypothetical protein